MRHSRRAFTLTEIAIALPLVAIVLAAICSLMQGTFRGVSRADARLASRERICAALSELRRELADARDYALFDGTLHYAGATGACTLAHDARSRALALVGPGGRRTLLEGRVTTYRPLSPRRGLVVLALEVDGQPLFEPCAIPGSILTAAAATWNDAD